MNRVPAIQAVAATIALCLSSVFAPATTTTMTEEQKKWPQEVEVNVGDIRTRIDGPKLWTLSGIEFKGESMATHDSAYGTVVTIRNVGHLGTAHFLDVPGKPNEIEKENVTSLKLTMDGRPIDTKEPKSKVSGKSFRMERHSKIRQLDLFETVSIQDGVLIETSNWHANEQIDLQMSYPLMYAWTPDATHYAFGDDNGIRKTGTFRTDGKSDDSGREKDSNWMAVFNAKTGKGSVCYLSKRPAGTETFPQWTDAPHIYRKLRIMTFLEQMVPKDFKGTYQAAVGFFEHQPDGWEKQAFERVKDVRAAANKEGDGG